MFWGLRSDFGRGERSGFPGFQIDLYTLGKVPGIFGEQAYSEGSHFSRFMLTFESSIVKE